jgi:hypothetical protein
LEEEITATQVQETNVPFRSRAALGNNRHRFRGCDVLMMRRRDYDFFFGIALGFELLPCRAVVETLCT